MKSFKPFILGTFLLLAAVSAYAQPRVGLLEQPTMNVDVREAHFVYLADGNQFEYRVTKMVNGVQVDPVFLRYTVTATQSPVAGAEDFFVLVQTYSEDMLIKQVQCYTRIQRGRIHLMGASVMGLADCNWQSPFSQQDMDINDEPLVVNVGGQTVPATTHGAYEHFWGDQNGDNGFISFRYAQGLGLYRFESRTMDSPMESDPVDESWLGELQYARVDGVEYGVSEVKARFDIQDVAPQLTPAQ